MTSNIGTRQLKDFGRGVGFATQNRLDDKEFSRSVIQKALNKSFAPEFLNRVDEIITFDQLSLEAKKTVLYFGSIAQYFFKKLYHVRKIMASLGIFTEKCLLFLWNMV